MQHPVTRISVNPQTMQQKTLDLVGRKHTVQAVKDIFHLARELGFDNINMDLIAGLPGENAEDMRDTLRQIEELSPDSLTVHSLAIKRAARMAQEQPVRDLHTEITEMVEDAAKTAEKLGLVPYYLYRQKNIAGNFENVGYAKDGCMSTYNINIMEEKQTIIALGGGGSTKIVMDDRIERVFNFKDPLEYIRRFDEILKKKDEILDILAGEKMADEQTLNHIMNEYEELRISAANERKKRIDEVNKKIPRVAEIDREIFNAVWKY